MEFTIFDFLGTVGAVLVMVAYFLLIIGRMEGRSFIYLILNALGSGLILFSLYFAFNWSAFFVEFFWLLISLVGLIRNLKNVNP